MDGAMRKSTACVRLFLACAVLAGFSLELASARCTCSDVQPRVSHDGPPLEEGCLAQRGFGKCNDGFMFNTIEELAEGYCQITCGRCDCCSTFEQLALNLGLVELVTALRIAELGDFLTNPGWMASVLAPQEGALSSWLNEKGWTWASVQSDGSQRVEMERMLSLHILPPVEPIDGLWTTPFFVQGMGVPSLSDEFPSLVAGRNPSTGKPTLSGPSTTVTILEGDKEFCKGFIHIVDTLLLPEGSGTGAPVTQTITTTDHTNNASEASDESADETATESSASASEVAPSQSKFTEKSDAVSETGSTPEVSEKFNNSDDVKLVESEQAVNGEESSVTENEGEEESSAPDNEGEAPSKDSTDEGSEESTISNAENDVAEEPAGDSNNEVEKEEPSDSGDDGAEEKADNTETNDETGESDSGGPQKESSESDKSGESDESSESGESDESDGVGPKKKPVSKPPSKASQSDSGDDSSGNGQTSAPTGETDSDLVEEKPASVKTDASKDSQREELAEVEELNRPKKPAKDSTKKKKSDGDTGRLG